MFTQRNLQITLAILSLVPLFFGVTGILFGVRQFGVAGGEVAALDSQFRFLSGCYVGLAIILWWIIPRIASATDLTRILCGAFFLGGVARLVSYAMVGAPPPVMLAGLALELGAPLIALWQTKIASAR